MSDKLGARIAARRKRLGMSLRRLSLLSGVSYSQISRCENNHSRPTQNTITKISRALQVSAEELIYSHPKKQNNDSNLRASKMKINDQEDRKAMHIKLSEIAKSHYLTADEFIRMLILREIESLKNPGSEIQPIAEFIAEQFKRI
ncbi:helix-turn-helix transcriptional regulator [Pseudomonas protegens]|uniref:helix-turn-helix domain-containing protein n=1 Tax=Pseudomonas protegens TaxID=380021 RepID=UPI0029374158|nr:helix-turn-helix transcriptional regulator [Pseudomonas protegens]WOE81606.1 helix-turn-helix transcriptional regulator [Pseudomonas protegens]